ncbi:uncharacterized protein LOC126557609 [Anopheles maculipalpis]|uniref:uncharacterized protein LOC126557609 n=1 Tax=Anopheles maculipalpis TaxID=1496333 RepID=UPI0021592CB0|nr:uncharacterized protein LOC126557609 [Anopheles maculipalpis]
MVTCQKWMVLLLSLQLLVVGTRAIPSPSSSNPPSQTDEDTASVQLDSDTGDDRELKSDDDGYDFLSIDQLFLNNPQYRQLISDLQAHTFGSNWRRKRDVAEHELPDAFRSDESLSSPRASTVPTTTTTTSTSAAVSSSTAAEALVTDVASTRDITSSSTTSDLPKAAALTSTPSKSKESLKEVTKPSTASSTIATSSSTTTTATTLSSIRGSSTVATSASYGSSGSTEAPASRNATLEMTTAAAPIRASTPRRLSHKNSSNKNKNKLSAAVAAAQAAASKPTTNASVGPSTVNVNKVSVSSNAVASSSSNQIPQQTPPAVAIPAPENGTAAGPAGNNKDKTGLAPTKYHYYPHNQHIYFLPECAIQQVCNAVYVRLNYTQPLCACPPRYRDPCSASLNEDDNHTIKLVGNQQKRAITLAKTCENTNELRDCRAPKDWSILALQNTRTGKSHYLVICKCPPHYRLEGPLAHDQPTYAGLPGINVYGMLCVPPETSSYYASKPAKTPTNVYNKWKIPSRQPVSSYRANSAAIAADTETESVSRTYQNTTDATSAPVSSDA